MALAAAALALAATPAAAGKLFTILAFLYQGRKPRREKTMNKTATAALAAALIFAIAAPAAALSKKEKSWITERLGLTKPAYVKLDRNSDIVIANIGDDLQLVAFCVNVETMVSHAGAFVTSLETFSVVNQESGSPRVTDALGFIIDSDKQPDLEDRPGYTFVAAGPEADARIATTPTGETFYFGRISVAFHDGGCEITIPITFGINGSRVVMFPEGRDPVPTPTATNHNGEYTLWSYREYYWDRR
jgi:hypothetical protein